MQLKEVGSLVGSTLKAGADKASDIYQKHAAKIWTGVCVTGAIFLPITSATAAIKSIRLIDAEEARLKRKLKYGEKIKLCWKCWFGTVAAVGITAGSALMSLNESEKKIALMATGIQVLSETNKNDILNKVEEVAGKKKRDEVANRLADDEVKDMTLEDIQHTKYGNDLWLEPYTGTVWYGDRNSVDAAKNVIKGIFSDNSYAHDEDREGPILKDFLDAIGVQTSSKLQWVKLSPNFDLRYPSMARLPNEKVCNVICYTECPFDNESALAVLKMRLWD